MVSTKQVVGTTVATGGVRRPGRKGSPNRAVEFKRGLATAACQPGVSVAKLALEHGVNTNLLFKWRREYRAGKFGTADPAHLPPPLSPDITVAATSPEHAVTLLPVHASTTEVVPVAAPACIEVVFSRATVRIFGVPEIAPLRTVLDCLARRA